MTAAVLIALLQLGPAREELRDSVQSERGLQLVASLVDLAEEAELGGRVLRIDDTLGTRVTSTTLPLRLVLEDPDYGPVRPLLEAAAAYVEASGREADIFAGTLPGQELGIDTEWIAYGAQAGSGVDIDLGSGFHFAPVLLAGLHHVENKTDYSGAGTPLWAPLFDDIVFNWKATVLSYGGALRIEAAREIGENLRWTTMARYDGRGHETLKSTDEAQEEVDPTHVLTARTDLSGPFGFSALGRPLGWTVALAFRRYLGVTAETLELRHYFEFGGNLHVGVGDLLPVLSKIDLGASVIAGPDVIGWTAGVSASF